MKSELTETGANLFATAFKLHTLGFSVIPSGGGDKGKAPIVNWVEYQHRQPTDDELANWQESQHPRLWGIVTGAISGVAVADADTPDARKELEAEIGPPHVVTPRGGAQPGEIEAGDKPTGPAAYGHAAAAPGPPVPQGNG